MRPDQGRTMAAAPARERTVVGGGGVRVHGAARPGVT